MTLAGINNVTTNTASRRFIVIPPSISYLDSVSHDCPTEGHGDNSWRTRKVLFILANTKFRLEDLRSTAHALAAPRMPRGKAARAVERSRSGGCFQGHPPGHPKHSFQEGRRGGRHELGTSVAHEVCSIPDRHPGACARRAPCGFRGRGWLASPRGGGGRPACDPSLQRDQGDHLVRRPRPRRPAHREEVPEREIRLP